MNGRPNRRNKAVFSNLSVLKSVSKKLRLRRVSSVDGRPDRKNKVVFSNISALRSVSEKLRFRDGL